MHGAKDALPESGILEGGCSLAFCYPQGSKLRLRMSWGNQSHLSRDIPCVNSGMEAGSAPGSGCFKQRELAEGPADLNEEAFSALTTFSKLWFAITHCFLL